MQILLPSKRDFKIKGGNPSKHHKSLPYLITGLRPKANFLGSNYLDAAHIRSRVDMLVITYKYLFKFVSFFLKIKSNIIRNIIEKYKNVKNKKFRFLRPRVLYGRC